MCIVRAPSFIDTSIDVLFNVISICAINRFRIERPMIIYGNTVTVTADHVFNSIETGLRLLAKAFRTEVH